VAKGNKVGTCARWQASVVLRGPSDNCNALAGLATTAKSAYTSQLVANAQQCA